MREEQFSFLIKEFNTYLCIFKSFYQAMKIVTNAFEIIMIYKLLLYRRTIPALRYTFEGFFIFH